MVKGKTDHNWKAKVLEWKASGKNGHAWSKENHIPYTTLLGWKRRFNLKKGKQTPSKENPSPNFIELKDQTPLNAGIYLEYDGIKICLEPEFDPIVLKKCLNCIRGAAC